MSSSPYDSYEEPNTIILRETDGIEFETQNAAAAIDPGDLIESASGEYQPHSADGEGRGRFALENDAWGKTIADAITAGESCTGAYGKGGTGFYAFLAAGENVTDTDVALTSAGNGALRAATTDADGNIADEVVAHSAEAVDNSGGSEKARIRVRC